jgi:uncharacterized Zn-binding protein involved in type VI secretion
MIDNQPAACAGDQAMCMGPMDTIAMGSTTVLIGNKPAARMGDPTSHGDMIAKGSLTVTIG